MSNDGRFDHLPRRIAESHHASGPFSFLNPTTRYVTVPAKKANRQQAGLGASSTANSPQAAHPEPSSADATTITNDGSESNMDSRPESNGIAKPQQAPLGAQQKPPRENVAGAYQVWRSRDNRKGRHAIVLTNDFFHHRYHSLHGGESPDRKKTGTGGGGAAPRSSNSWRGIAHILWKMVVCYPLWDVSYDVAMIFTIGSIIWVINSFFVWLPLAAPWTEFTNEETTGGGVTALIGATVFEVGAILGVLEAVNENRADCFGWALEEALESGVLSLRPSPEDCKHAHVERTRLFTRRRKSRQHHGHRPHPGHGKTVQEETSVGGQPIGQMVTDDSSSGSDMDHTTTAASTSTDSSRIHPQRRNWVWWPSWQEMRTVYAREMGFWACAIQLFGATVFWISGFTGIPPIANRLSTAATNGAFWVPQVVGGWGFIISSVMFMLETQRKWYLPAPQLLGWHIGFWNLVGAIGFTLCGALGFGAATNDAVSYASSMSTFVGSWAFLIGSIIQWYESLDKHPIQIQDSLPSHVEQ
ncbi:hypothetical protein SBRCBS47491_000197 [Sporothrix bragantina]|uniref:Integral membrane protein n=1 Tax=Sporothrix bragantina TaxID=671064 RepID=A0ABP0ANE4_9PEZI